MDNETFWFLQSPDSDYTVYSFCSFVIIIYFSKTVGVRLNE